MPFENETLRREWTQCNYYLEDRCILTYRNWLEAEREIGLDVLEENGPDFLPTYLEYQRSILAELKYLDDNGY